MQILIALGKKNNQLLGLSKFFYQSSIESSHLNVVISIGSLSFTLFTLLLV